MMNFSADTTSFWHSLGDSLIVNLHIGDGFAALVDYMQDHFEAVFDGIAATINFVAESLTAFFNFL